MPSAPATQSRYLGSITHSGTNSVVFYPTTPTRIIRIVAVSTTATTVASSTLTGNIEQADGTATTPSGAAALGTVTLSVANSGLNAVVYQNVQANVGDRIVYPGERVEIISDGGATAGAAQISIEIEPLGFANADVRSHVSSHPGSTDLATALAGATEVTS